ncbi:MAG: DUF4115 domain-containing protein [Desulfovibrionaceae bacterium]
MIFEELGPLFRAEREKKGFSIDDVAVHLKISGRIIRALEDGDEEALPHNVYVRGFVRSYAGFLGFNDEELSTALEAVNADENPAAPQAVYTPIDQAPLPRKKLLVALFALCIVAAGGYWYVQDSDLLSDGTPTAVVLSTAKPAPPLKASSEDTPPEKTASAQQTNTSAVAPAPTAHAVPNSQPAPPTASATRPAPFPATPSSTPAPPLQTTATAPVSPQENQQGPHKLIITALAECWIHSNADSTDTRQFSLRKGDTFALTFTKKLTLKLGNAGGVRIRYDGEDLPAPGTDGQVRTLIFPLEP